MAQIHVWYFRGWRGHENQGYSARNTDQDDAYGKTKQIYHCHGPMSIIVNHTQMHLRGRVVSHADIGSLFHRLELCWTTDINANQLIVWQLSPLKLSGESSGIDMRILIVQV